MDIIDKRRVNPSQLLQNLDFAWRSPGLRQLAQQFESVLKKSLRLAEVQNAMRRYPLPVAGT